MLPKKDVITRDKITSAINKLVEATRELALDGEVGTDKDVTRKMTATQKRARKKLDDLIDQMFIKLET